MRRDVRALDSQPAPAHGGGRSAFSLAGMTAAEVIQMIEDAWRDVPYPGDEKIFTPDSYDDEDIVSYFGRTTWRDHAPAKLRAHSSAFTFFTPEAFHYWLPAFVIAAIQDPDEADVVVDRIPGSVSDSYAPERWPLFTQAQREALAAYFRFQIGKFPESAEEERKALAILETANKSLQATAAPPGS
jgi:hypothetical protein